MDSIIDRIKALIPNKLDNVNIMSGNSIKIKSYIIYSPFFIILMKLMIIIIMN